MIVVCKEHDNNNNHYRWERGKLVNGKQVKLNAEPQMAQAKGAIGYTSRVGSI